MPVPLPSPVDNRSTTLPEAFVKKVFDLLEHAGFEGVQLANFGRAYFEFHNVGMYIEKYGYRSWGEILTSKTFQGRITVFNDGQNVRSSQFD